MPRYGGSINQTCSPESEKRWREKSRETWAKRKDFTEKHGCYQCQYFKGCETLKSLKEGCEYATY